MEGRHLTVAFAVERFERVDASAGTVLLRLSGRFEEAPETVELLVDDGRDATSHLAVARPEGPRAGVARGVPRAH